jgi:hypothetical protein
MHQYQPNPGAMMPIPINVPPPMLHVQSSYQPHGLKRPTDWAHHANKRPFYGVPEEPLSKTCSRCNKECKKEDYAKRQWVKKDGERKCSDCVKAVLAANRAIVENIHGIPPGSSSLLVAEKVSPSSSVTNELPSEVRRVCSRCKLPHDWTKFTKTQWVAAALVRKCKECLEEEKQIKKKVDQEQGIQALLMMSGQVSESTEDPMKAALKAAADRKAAEAAKLLANPEAVYSVSKSTDVADPKGILKPASHDSASPDLVRSNVVVKEVPSGLVFGGPTVTNEEGSFTGSAGVGSAGGGPNTVGIKPGGIPNMRRCSKCHRDCDHNHFSKTQWLMSSIFRRCKRCMGDDAEAVKAFQRTQDINDRRFMYGDTSKPRECTSCKLELEWDKFSKRQWIAVECARRCKACVNKSLAEMNK